MSRVSGQTLAAVQLDLAARARLTHALRALPDSDPLCHGDFHPWNIIDAPTGATVIDWLDASSGHPAPDVCRSFVLLRHARPQFAYDYVDAYAERSGITPSDIFAWLPCIAAARLAEDVPEEEEALLGMARD